MLLEIASNGPVLEGARPFLASPPYQDTEYLPLKESRMHSEIGQVGTGSKLVSEPDTTRVAVGQVSFRTRRSIIPLALSTQE